MELDLEDLYASYKFDVWYQWMMHVCLYRIVMVVQGYVNQGYVFVAYDVVVKW